MPRLSQSNRRTIMPSVSGQLPPNSGPNLVGCSELWMGYHVLNVRAAPLITHLRQHTRTHIYIYIYSCFLFFQPPAHMTHTVGSSYLPDWLRACLFGWQAPGWNLYSVSVVLFVVRKRQVEQICIEFVAEFWRGRRVLAPKQRPLLLEPRQVL